MKNFGSSKNPDYLKGQIAQTNKLLSEQGWRLSRSQVLSLHQELDQLHSRLLSITDPTTFWNTRNEWEASRNNDNI